MLNTAWALPVPVDLSTQSEKQATRAWPVTAPLPSPDGLRPCCAFGYNLRAKLLGIPVPLYRLNNIVEEGNLGEHEYNDRLLGALLNLSGLSRENDGIIYTRRGGFIDIAHVRDSADMTFYLFSHLRAHRGQRFALTLSDELTHREVVTNDFTAPENAAEAYTLDAWLAGWLAFQLAAWHEIAQWYGYHSVPEFPEDISAFSPEDLYSNLLGVRLAVSLLLDGHGASTTDYNIAMTRIIPEALVRLGGVPAALTRFQLDMLDGRWWDSHRAVPDKFLVLKRNYQTNDDRLPTPVPGETLSPLRLTLPHELYGRKFTDLARLKLCVGNHMARLPKPDGCYSAESFDALALSARAEDARQLSAQSFEH
ncbi:hypothetical protein TUM12370_38340 [Salmonella enterica subsp. enterica serovar Choleraesuis]|nr:hypothetical protein TUM12370_38340 [Salmonella enterica subsp. enterica serovar Choleraesuis]